MLPHYIIQNVSLLRWYRKSRWMIYQSVQKVPWKYVIGITIATPFIAIAQGTYLLHGMLLKIEQMNEMRTCECVSVSHCFPSFFTAPPDTQSIDAIMVMHPHRTYQVGAWWWWSDKVITITTTAVRRNHQESYWIPHHSNDLRPWLRLLLPVVQLPAMGLRMVLP